VLGRVDGVELTALTDDGRELTVFTPHAGGAARARFVLLSPKHPETERWAGSPGVRAQLEEMRLGGWERSSRAAESMALVDTGHTVSLAGGMALRVAVSPVVDERFGATAVLGVPELDRTDALIGQRLGVWSAEEAEGDESPVDPAARGHAYTHARGGAADIATPTASGGTADAATSPAMGDGADNGAASPTAGGSAADAATVPAAPAAARYRANDFSISRQRAWGTPIPIVYCERCGTVPLPREQLPVLLPLDLKPTGEGNPLAEREDFVQTSCPTCGGAARRETDTLDCHFDALWLWVPACVPAQERERPLEEIFALGDLRAWLPSERLVAGSDSGNFMFDQRIATKALRDIGPLAFLEQGEPFAGALMHEMVIRDGRKMSKHLGNVVDPDELVATFGADTVRLAVLWAARPQKSLNWSDSAVQYCNRFLHGLWRYAQARFAMVVEDSAELDPYSTEFLRKRLEKWCEIAVEKITEDLTNLEMHKAVRNVIRLLDRIKDFESRVLKRSGALCREDHAALLDALALMATVLAPFAPHIALELLCACGREGPEADPPWPCERESSPADDARRPSPADDARRPSPADDARRPSPADDVRRSSPASGGRKPSPADEGREPSPRDDERRSLPASDGRKRSPAGGERVQTDGGDAPSAVAAVEE
jgi:leucyl-tRNA synthetase